MYTNASHICFKSSLTVPLQFGRSFATAILLFNLTSTGRPLQQLFAKRTQLILKALGTINKIITIMIVAMVALTGVLNTSLTNSNNLTIYRISQTGTGCYSSGEPWDNLGSWKDIHDALQISGVMRVHDIPAGYHVSCSDLAVLLRPNTNHTTT